MRELPKVKDLPDYEHRKWLAQNILGLEETPELDPNALEQLDSILSHLDPIDAVELVKSVRENIHLLTNKEERG